MLHILLLLLNEFYELMMKVKETAPAYRTQQKVFTYQDYLDLPEDSHEYQVINGELVMSPSPYTIHQEVSGNIFIAVKIFTKETKIGKVYHAPLDVVLSETNVFQPDILFVSNENAKITTEKNISGAPDLIIEILSPSTGYYDLTEKKEIYAEFGVKEYWIVDPKKQWVEIYTNENKHFKSSQRLEKSGTLKSGVLHGFKTNLKKVFDVE